MGRILGCVRGTSWPSQWRGHATKASFSMSSARSFVMNGSGCILVFIFIVSEGGELPCEWCLKNHDMMIVFWCWDEMVDFAGSRHATPASCTDGFLWYDIILCFLLVDWRFALRLRGSYLSRYVSLDLSSGSWLCQIVSNSAWAVVSLGGWSVRYGRYLVGR